MRYDGSYTIFNTMEEVKHAVFSYLCDQCVTEENIAPDSPISDMLFTACGCELDLEEIEC